MAETPPKHTLATKQKTAEILGVVENCESRTKARSAIPSKFRELTFPDVDAKYHDSIQKTLALFADMWSEKLIRIITVERRNDLTLDSRSIRSAPYRAGPKTRKLEESKTKKQLKVNIIELATSEGASPVLFVSKKEDSF